MNYSIKDLNDLMEKVNNELKEQKKNFKLVSNYCYGAYGINICENGQTGQNVIICLETKKHCYKELKSYYNGLIEGGQR